MQPWRQLLGEIIADPREKQRMADQLKLSTLTLTRWSQGISVPRLNNLRLLLKAVPPRHQQRMHELLKQEYGEFIDQASQTQSEEEDALLQIPSSLYERVFHAYAQLADPIMVESIIELALQHALKQLDPDRLGMEISIAQCVPPAVGCRVQSLRETYRYKNPGWGENTRYNTMFLGEEALAGFTLRQAHIVVIESRSEGQTRFPASWVEHEESAAACPILRFDKVAGCLICSSTQPDYFTPGRCALVVAYSEMVALAFEREQFFESKDLALRIMPQYHEQESHIATFRQRFMRIMTEQRLHAKFATQLAWQEIEKELIQHSE